MAVSRKNPTVASTLREFCDPCIFKGFFFYIQIKLTQRGPAAAEDGCRSSQQTLLQMGVQTRIYFNSIAFAFTLMQLSAHQVPKVSLAKNFWLLPFATFDTENEEWISYQ